MRTQSSLAVQLGEEHWMLINASPDLRMQIEAAVDLRPNGKSTRASYICDVLLTNADLDHVLGLFLLRELGQRLRVHCTVAVRETLRGAMRLDALLEPFCGIDWHDLSGSDEPFTLGEPSNQITCRAIGLPGDPPRYTKGVAVPSVGQSIALEFSLPAGKRLLVAPDVAAITPELQSALETADAVFFDGTFWSEEELRRVDPQARLASQMGHLPIEDGSLPALRNLPARHRVYTHINNTNPIFASGSSERAAVEAAGIIVGEDGMEFEL